MPVFSLIGVLFIIIIITILALALTDNNYVVPISRESVGSDHFSVGTRHWIHNPQNYQHQAIRRPTVLLAGECVISTRVQTDVFSLPVRCFSHFEGSVIIIPWFSSCHATRTDFLQPTLLSILLTLQLQSHALQVLVLYDDPYLSVDFILQHSTHHVMFLHAPSVLALPPSAMTHCEVIKSMVMTRSILLAAPDIIQLAVLKLHVDVVSHLARVVEPFLSHISHSTFSIRPHPNQSLPLWISGSYPAVLELTNAIVSEVDKTQTFNSNAFLHGIEISSSPLLSLSVKAKRFSKCPASHGYDLPTYVSSGECVQSYDPASPHDCRPCIPLHGDVIFTTYITGDTTYKIGTPSTPSETEDEYFINWMDSIVQQDLRAIILYNQYDPEIIIRHTSHHIIWRKIQGFEQYSSNDRRFFNLRAIAQYETLLDGVMLTDGRDIVFHENPFSHLRNPQQLPFSGERHLPRFFVGLDQKKFIFKDNYGTQNPSHDTYYCYPKFPPPDLTEFSDLVMLNAGIMMALRSTILSFLSDFEIETIRLIGHQPDQSLNFDCNMGVFAVCAMRQFKEGVIDLYFGAPFSTYLKSGFQTAVNHKEATYSNSLWIKRSIYRWWYDV